MLYSIVYVAMETTKMSHFTCQSKYFISMFFNLSLANDIYTQTAKTVFSHLKHFNLTVTLNHRLVRLVARITCWSAEW